MLKVQEVYREISPADRESARRYLEKIWERFERLTRHINPDLKLLRVVVEGLEKKKTYYVHLTLSLPWGVLSARGEHKRLKSAFKVARERLEREYAEAAARIRGEAVYKRKNRYYQELSAAFADLAADRQAGLKERFDDRLKPILRNLYRIARREIIFYQLTGDLPPGAIDPADIVDEVILWAYEHYDDLVATSSLPLVLHQKMIEILRQEVAKYRGERISIEEELPLDDVRFRLQEDLDSPYYEPELLRWEDVLPSDVAVEPEEVLSAEELTNLIMRELSHLPEEKRQAFVWHVIDGYDIMEVAKIIGVSKEEIARWIEEVRGHLKTRWLAGRPQAEEEGGD
ncbi:sigma-70 family RNA polymerase sigma factor [Thermosulfuriphilus sp.]